MVKDCDDIVSSTTDDNEKCTDMSIFDETIKNLSKDELKYPIEKDTEKSVIAEIVYNNPKYSAMTTFTGYDTSVGHFNSWTEKICGEAGQEVDIKIDPNDYPSIHNFNNMAVFISAVWGDEKISFNDVKNISIKYNGSDVISLSAPMCFNILTLNSKLFSWVYNVVDSAGLLVIPIQYILMENDIMNLSALTSPLHVVVKSEKFVDVMVEMECYTVSKKEHDEFIKEDKVYRRFHYDIFPHETKFGFVLKMTQILPVSDILVTVHGDKHFRIKLDNMTFSSGKSLYSSLLGILDNRPDRPEPVSGNIHYLSCNKMNALDKHSITDHYIIKDKYLHVQRISLSDEDDDDDKSNLIIVIKMTGTMTFPNYKSNNSLEEPQCDEKNVILDGEKNNDEFVVLKL